MLTRLKVSFVLIALAILLVVGGYVYSLWAADRQAAAATPVEATSMMIRDLLAFHKKRGSFPKDLEELEGVIWDKKKSREFSIGNRGFLHRNYFYFYTRLDPHHLTLWAIPTGQIPDEAATIFVSGSQGVFRTWKGAALSPDFVGGIKVNPSEIELGSLGLIEQTKIVSEKR